MLCIIHLFHNAKGDLNTRPSCGSHGNFDVKLPKVGIVVRWPTCLALDFRCILQPVKMGGYSSRMGHLPWLLPGLFTLVQSELACTRCSPLKGDNNLHEPLNSRIAPLGIK